MNLLRRRFPRFAAIVLLVWLFATGAAFAQTCAAMTHVLCEECCTEMKAAPAPGELRQQAPSPPQVSTGWLVPSATTDLPLPAQADATAFLAVPLDARPRERIPILFLRLAL